MSCACAGRACSVPDMTVQTRRLESFLSLGAHNAARRLRRRWGPVALPERALRVDDVAVDRERLARYQRQCGFPMNDLLPQTFRTSSASPSTSPSWPTRVSAAGPRPGPPDQPRSPHIARSAPTRPRYQRPRGHGICAHPRAGRLIETTVGCGRTGLGGVSTDPPVMASRALMTASRLHRTGTGNGSMAARRRRSAAPRRVGTRIRST